MELIHIAEKTDVSVDWLNKLLAGEIPNPGYSRVKAVIDFVMTG
jgi:predicted transcriptional regulator